jgi:hypothetical protein
MLFLSLCICATGLALTALVFWLLPEDVFVISSDNEDEPVNPWLLAWWMTI